MYVKSCPEDKCLPEDRFPSQGSRDKEVWGKLNRALSHHVVVLFCCCCCWFFFFFFFMLPLYCSMHSWFLMVRWWFLVMILG